MCTRLHESVAQDFRENHWSSTRKFINTGSVGKPEPFTATKATSRRRQSECEVGRVWTKVLSQVLNFNEHTSV